MKKKLPAKKGSGPARENKFGNGSKPAGTRKRPFSDNEKSERASAKDDKFTPRFKRDDNFDKKAGGFDKKKDDKFGKFEEKSSFKNRFDNKKSDEKPGFKKRFDKNSEEKPTFKSRFDKSEEKSSFRSKFGNKNSDEKPGFKKRFDKSEEKPGFRSKFGSKNADEKPAFKNRFDKSEEKPPFKSKFDGNKSEEKSSFKSPSGDRPLRKRTYKKTGDDSAFHFHGDNKKGGKNFKDTPSGFNRQKFFDKTNERFGDKQERKIQRKNDNQATKVTKEPKESIFGPGEMPLNKFVAHCGLCSRRKAVDYIKEGKVTVNGEVVTEPATKVTADDVVTMQQKRITPTKNLIYILLNKPKGYITTTDDPEGRKTVMDLIEEAAENERVYPVGRLDRNTSGLLLLTNDGELAQRLAHPKHNIRKIYQVELDKTLTKPDFEKIINGVTLEDGVAVVDALGYVDPKDKKQVGIEIHSGKNRIVRRIFEHLEYSVEKLDRVMYAGLTKKNLNRGQWRFLTEKEVILLKHFKTNL
ncbi:pseudouridine synthase [Chitinophaga silvatica]|nr:pseudouridine synthase [Chitinophaga silvatica]